MVLKRVGVLSVAKILALLYAVIGFVVGAFFSLFAMLGFFATALENDFPAPFLAGLFGLGAIIVMPVLYGILGFVIGVIVSALYNGLSGLLGGVQLELE